MAGTLLRSTVVASSTGRRAATRTRPRRFRRGTPVIGLLPLVVVLGLWQLFGSGNSSYFPKPSTWYTAVKPLTSNGTLWTALGATCETFGIALAAATIIGAVLGTVVGSHGPTDRALSPLLEFLRTLPASALVPIVTLVLGYTLRAKLVVVIVPATWPVLLNVRAARRSMSSLMTEVARTLGLSRRDRVTKILIPTLIPPTLLGVRLAAPLTLVITLLFEIITKLNGLGALLNNAQANFVSAQVWGLIFIAGILALGVNGIVVWAEVAVARRMHSEADR